MQDLIFISLENWDHVWRRNQFVCAGLANRYPDKKILFVGPARDATNNLRRLQFSRSNVPATWNVPDLPNITVTRPLKLLPNSIAACRHLNDLLARRHIQTLARRLNLQSPILWLNPHAAVHMAGRMGEEAVIYDITDDWTTLTQSEASRKLVIKQDARLCRRADAVIVCSQHLFDLKRDLAARLHLIPNGVDARKYECVLDGIGPLPEESRNWPRPVLGYVGTIHPDRVDVALVEAVARRVKGTIALIGPMMLGKSDVARLLACGNVVMPGEVPYARVPDFMRAFDVSITPHHVTPFTQSLNPIKLWEYLAAGKPIVSTRVSGFTDYPDLVYLASDADEFERGIQMALKEEVRLRDARRREAEKHSWETRLDAIENVFEACLRRSVPDAASARLASKAESALAFERLN